MFLFYIWVIREEREGVVSYTREHNISGEVELRTKVRRSYPPECSLVQPLVMPYFHSGAQYPGRSGTMHKSKT